MKSKSKSNSNTKIPDTRISDTNNIRNTKIRINPDFKTGNLVDYDWKTPLFFRMLQRLGEFEFESESKSELLERINPFKCGSVTGLRTHKFSFKWYDEGMCGSDEPWRFIVKFEDGNYAFVVAYSYDLDDYKPNANYNIKKFVVSKDYRVIINSMSNHDYREYFYTTIPI